MVVTTTIRAATAIVIRSMAPPLFGRDCVWCVKASVELIGWSPVADMRTQIERAALRRYFSLGKKVAVVAKHPAKTRCDRAPFVNCFTYAERGLIYQAPMCNGHWRSKNGSYFEFSFPRNRTQSRQRNGPNYHHLLRNRIAPFVTLPNPALNLSDRKPADANGRPHLSSSGTRTEFNFDICPGTNPDLPLGVVVQGTGRNSNGS